MRRRRRSLLRSARLARLARGTGPVALSLAIAAGGAGLLAVSGSAGWAQDKAQSDRPLDLGTDEQRAAGGVVFHKYCSQCHGDDGAGDGIAAPFLRPAPRDFTAGKYKIRSTPTGYLPTRDDLEHSVRHGLPGTGMPAFDAALSDKQVEDVVYYIESLSPDFQDPQAYAAPIEIPDPPPFSEDSLETGFETYVQVGCARCHGDKGRGDGRSAPTLRDDWGDFIPPADLSMPWNFRGGGSRQDIYRSISTGLYGTPMAGFADGLTEEQRWQIVDWIVAQARETGATDDPGQAPYDTLVRAVPHLEGLDGIAPGASLDEARKLFDGAPKALFPVIGQVTQPGRDFRPGTVAVGVQAIYDTNDVAFLVTWHNLTADTKGSNAPDLEVPRQHGVPFRGYPEGDEAARAGAAEGTKASEPEEAGKAGEATSADDFWGTGGSTATGKDTGTAAKGDSGGDFWGTGGGASDTGSSSDEGGAAAFFGGGAEQAAPGRPAGSDEFSDAVALQFPIELRDGVEKPYFLFGDPSYPVELWYMDLAHPQPKLYEGRGTGALTLSDADPPQALSGYADGEWAVIFKQPRKPTTGITFAEETFVPISVSVWDGFYRERGGRRGLTRWFHVYVEPTKEPAVVAPMVKAGLGVLLVELLIIGLVRRKAKTV